VPSLLSHSFNLIPTENPSRKPSAASSNESSPAIVPAILNDASMPVSVTSYFVSFPIGRVRSCSSKSFTFLGIVIESFANIVLPAEVKPSSPQVTMRPVSVRLCVSAAVNVIGRFTFI